MIKHLLPPWQPEPCVCTADFFEPVPSSSSWESKLKGFQNLSFAIFNLMHKLCLSAVLCSLFKICRDNNILTNVMLFASDLKKQIET